jgi:hypothetical protein
MLKAMTLYHRQQWIKDLMFRMDNPQKLPQVGRESLSSTCNRKSSYPGGDL